MILLESSTTWVDVLFAILLAISFIIVVVFRLFRDIKNEQDDEKYIP